MIDIKQEIKLIKISDLYLWSENPRDPIDSDIGDFGIIKRAVHDVNQKWNITKFIKKMGEHYDFSELPTVVLKKKKYYIYDGNRRIAILKYLQNPNWSYQIENKLFPSHEPKNLKELSEIPCNVCDEKTALLNIERKHISDGSWGQLERDYFEYHFKKKEKSLFVKFEESTGLISKNPKLNENIMKNDILTEKNLKEVGFSFNNKGDLISIYDVEIAKKILDKIVELKINKTISSRSKNKYNIKKSLIECQDIKGKIKDFNKLNSTDVNYNDKNNIPTNIIRKTKRLKNPTIKFFGEDLKLKSGVTNSIYMDILDLYVYFLKNKTKLSNTFPNIIRMALRLLIDSAKNKQTDNISIYINSNFNSAKSNLNQDQKTTLSNNNVTQSNLNSLLHTGAHNYSSASNLEQTIAMSIIIGQMLKITHGIQR